MTINALPSEIHYHILHYLPSKDITKLAYIACLADTATLLLTERARASMKEGWRLMIGAVTRLSHVENDRESVYEEGIEHVCQFSHVNPRTLQLYFTVQTISDDGYCSLVNIAPVQAQFNIVPGDLGSNSAQQCIFLPADSTTNFQINLVKENAKTQLLEYATSLDDSFTGQLATRDHSSLTSEAANNLCLQESVGMWLHFRLVPCSEELRQQPPLYPILSLHLDTLETSATWWWDVLDQYETAGYFIDHRYW
ncbi:hypothetical protein DM01DRAFT_1374956 [Hesseltinella vesiculosa]|uniref:F-box domain-containing protein n=1 Tax=Hesseltinella vesiculosa TaxID=101127 RepID=A0A1X2GF07_9FUNG|nr:hypothetical protein DM01DRAFT_1374956 [Hesseltinella vesiculosa]